MKTASLYRVFYSLIHGCGSLLSTMPDEQPGLAFDGQAKEFGYLVDNFNSGIVN